MWGNVALHHWHSGGGVAVPRALDAPLATVPATVTADGPSTTDIAAILRAATPAARAPVFDRPSWRGRMHTWAAVVAVPACVVLVLSADTLSAQVASAIYSLTLVAVFVTSAAYHRLTRTERARRIMQRADHSMIYLLIAGTYAPLCVVALPPEWGIPVLVAIGSAALIGVVLKLTAFERRRRLSYALYPMMGWGVVVAAPALADHLSSVELALVIGGGLAYTSGLPVLITRRPNPWPAHFGYHEIWHVMTIVAAGLHFAAVATVVV